MTVVDVLTCNEIVMHMEVIDAYRVDPISQLHTWHTLLAAKVRPEPSAADGGFSPGAGLHYHRLCLQVHLSPAVNLSGRCIQREAKRADTEQNPGTCDDCKA